MPIQYRLKIGVPSAGQVAKLGALTMNTRIRVTIVVIFGAMAGIAFFHLIPRSFVDPSKWPSTQGAIVQADIGSRSSQKGGSRDYYLRITYTYAVAGVQLANNSAGLLDDPIATSFLRGNLERLKEAEYAVGRSVRVYYDPRNPKRAVLDTTPASWGRRIGFIIVGFAGCLGVLVGLFGKTINPRKR